MQGVVLTVRMNEFSMRTTNPNVPWTPEEIAADAAACAEAGASIVHFHGRDPDTGAPDTRASTLSDTVKLVQDACDAVTYCTLGAGTGLGREERLATLTDAIAKPEIAPVDLGSFNLDPYNSATQTFRIEEGVYVNTVGTVRYLVEGVRASGAVPAAVAWSVGSLRLLGALIEQGAWPTPVYSELVVSDRMLSVHPATADGLEALLRFMPSVPTTWTVMCGSGSILPLVDTIVAAGGGLAFGLGDHLYPELGGAPTNADVVRAVVERLHALGRRPATPDEVREAVGR